MIKTIASTKWFPVFRSGEHTGYVPGTNAPVTKKWTERDIDAIVAKNNARAEDIPAVLGHPTTDAPAYGWGMQFEKRIHDGVAYVYARLKDVVQEFADMVGAGQYKKVSVKIRPDLTLAHIGFLGAAQPAVDGLVPVAFAEGDCNVPEFALEFSAGEPGADSKDIFSGIIGMLQKIREFVIDKFSTEEAEKAAPGWELDYLRRNVDRLNEKSNINYSTPTDGGNMNELQELQAKFSELSQKVVQFTEEIGAIKIERDALKTQNQSLVQEIGTLKAEKEIAGYTQFCNDLVTEGKMKPADVKANVAIMVGLAKSEDVQFSEGESKSPLGVFQEQLKSREAIQDDTEFARRDNAGAPEPGSAEKTVNEKVQEKLSADKTLQFSVALSDVLNANPDLAQQYEAERRQ